MRVMEVCGVCSLPSMLIGLSLTEVSIRKSQSSDHDVFTVGILKGLVSGRYT